MSNAPDNPNFEGYTSLVSVRDKIGVKYQQPRFEYLYISGYGIFRFTTEYKKINCISIMGSKTIPYPIVIGEKNTYFLTDHNEHMQNENLEGLDCS